MVRAQRLRAVDAAGPAGRLPADRHLAAAVGRPARAGGAACRGGRVGRPGGRGDDRVRRRRRGARRGGLARPRGLGRLVPPHRRGGTARVRLWCAVFDVGVGLTTLLAVLSR
ncbi:hypothetical protein V2I01_35770 [Micromonospora sp. BRA006-A]|nr:hypothetical protein [Micromonospora sp. BRA006-A]